MSLTHENSDKPELSLTWINRVLFLKLLEAQLLKYARGNRKFSFLNFETVRTYGELNVLFFQVLAEPEVSRSQHAKEKFPNVPYLNSSLFEITDLEKKVRQQAQVPGLRLQHSLWVG